MYIKYLLITQVLTVLVLHLPIKAKIYIFSYKELFISRRFARTWHVFRSTFPTDAFVDMSTHLMFGLTW